MKDIAVEIAAVAPAISHPTSCASHLPSQKEVCSEDRSFIAGQVRFVKTIFFWLKVKIDGKLGLRDKQEEAERKTWVEGGGVGARLSPGTSCGLNCRFLAR